MEMQLHNTYLQRWLSLINANYRPISILPRLSLILERLIFNFLYPRIKSQLAKQQHGFRKHRSTVTQLLAYLDNIYNQLENNKKPSAVYFDFQKAFDKVPHVVLLHKLKKIGLDPSFIELIRSYLADRTQCVNINGVLSYIASVTSGVPQGSVLGPLLFIIFINDLPDYCKYSDCFLFANDSKMISTESPIAKNLQHDIDNFLAWSIENSMTFHPDKCKTMLSGKTDDTYQLTIGNHQISTVSCIKDIGVWVADDLSWRPHIEKKLASANRSLFVLKKKHPNYLPHHYQTPTL